MKMLIRYSLCLLLIHISCSVASQELVNRIRALNSVKYADWVTTYRNFMEEKKAQGITNFSGTGYKQVARLLWFHRDRLDKEGNIVNSDLYNWKAYKDFVQQNQNREFAFASPQTAEWTYGGPFNIRNNSGIATGTGRITFIKLDPNDAGNANAAWIYVGAPKGGLWRSTFNKNTGLVSTWTCLTDGLPNIGAVDICIHPSNRNIIYLVSGDKNAGVGNSPSGIGIMKSTDAGESWLPTNFYDDEPPTFTYGIIRKLIMDSGNPNRMWAATSNGIYRTQDGWQTFTQEQTGSFWDIEKGQNVSNQNLIACTSSRVYTSNDFGDTWTVVNQTGSSTDYTYSSNRAELAVSQHLTNDRSFYLWYVNGGFNSTTNSFKFHNGNSNTWTDKTGTGSTVHVYSDYCMAFEASQSNSNFIYAGGVGLQQSSDGGNNWININDGVPGGGTFSGDIHADQHYMAWDQGFLFLGNDGGIYNYNYDLGGWRYLGDGMHISQYYRIGYYNGPNGFAAVCGAQDMGTHLSSTHVGCCDGMEALVNYNNPDIFYISWQGANVARTTNGGSSFSDFFPAGFQNSDVWITPMAMHKTNPAIIALAELDGSTGKIEIYNGSWDEKASISGEIRWLAFATSAPNVLYGITNDQIIKISDVTSGSPTINIYNLPTSSATCVAVDPNNSTHVFYTEGGYGGDRVYESTNSGSSWTPITLNLPNVPVNCILMNSGTNDELYVGTDIGVFVKLPAWSYWAPFMNGLPNTRVTDLDLGAGLLTCATYGRGRWFTNVYGACVPDLDLTPVNDPSNPNTTGYQYYTAGDTISSTRVVTGGTGTDVTYRAVNSVTLKDGFHARENNRFTAMIGPCFPGGPAPLGGKMIQDSIRPEKPEFKVPSPRYDYMRPNTVFR